jgi:hypothetical protein
MSNTCDYINSQCPYCGNWHSYSPECCQDLKRMFTGKKDQLQQIIDILKDIRYNTDRLRVK